MMPAPNIYKYLTDEKLRCKLIGKHMQIYKVMALFYI